MKLQNLGHGPKKEKEWLKINRSGEKEGRGSTGVFRKNHYDSTSYHKNSWKGLISKSSNQKVRAVNGTMLDEKT